MMLLFQRLQTELAAQQEEAGIVVTAKKFNSDGMSGRLRVLTDSAAQKTVSGLYTRYVSEENLSHFTNFWHALDKLLNTYAKAVGGKGGGDDEGDDQAIGDKTQKKDKNRPQPNTF